MTRLLGGGELGRHIREKFPDAVEEEAPSWLWITPNSIGDVSRFLKDHPDLNFIYLNSITAVDYIDHFELVYHLTSFQHNHSAMVKARVHGRGEPEVPSVIDVWPGADFQEREIWDLMGIWFEGHPNMKRIMLWEGFEGHPLRKDFKDTVEY